MINILFETRRCFNNFNVIFSCLNAHKLWATELKESNTHYSFVPSPTRKLSPLLLTRFGRTSFSEAVDTLQPLENGVC